MLLPRKTQKTMTVNNVNISIETFQAIANGRCVEGSLRLQTTSDGQQQVVFRAYNRNRKPAREQLIYRLEHGWVKESKRRIKLFESLPKELGGARMVQVLEREMADVRTTFAWLRHNS